MAIDYGQKRVGLAVTDEGQIIATALDTVHVKDIFQYLKQYIGKENVSSFVVGDPKQLDNTPSESVRFVDPFVKKLRKEFPEIKVERYDERFTSKMAFQSMIDMGMKKKDRRDKANIDKISAVILLQSYMNYLSGKR
jgi:putative Holliday junction resolvase